MARSVIVGSGAEIPPNRVTNDMLARVIETSDDWVRERSGVETRYYVDLGTATSDLAVAASRKALEMAAASPEEIDLVVVATMTPDHYFPGVGGILQSRLGLRTVPCFDIRQQCVGFVYGLQLADAHVRAGLARTVLLVGAEVHSGFFTLSAANWETLYGRSNVPPTPEELDLNNRFRHLTVLFGDAGAAVVIRANGGERGVIDSLLCADGSEYRKLYVPGNGFRHRPYIDAEQIRRGDQFPFMDGRAVFRMATTKMISVAQEILARNGLCLDDVAMVLMHQANKRINEYVQKALGIPDHKVLHNIERYGNTTAGTIPLLWDECARGGRLKPGDLVLLVAFGAGMSWGASLLRA